ncbi:TPA: RraA family protein [Legionella pneumophila]|nr:RraA family protein [Legionella pneumophila]
MEPVTYQTLLNQLIHLNTTHICDAMRQVRLLYSSIIPVIKNKKIIGRAVTVDSRGDSLSIIKALQISTPDSVLVIDSCDAPHALIGEIFAIAALNKKIQGVVLDGFYRDVNEVKAIGLPIYAKGTCARAGTKNKIGSIQEKITCGGVEVLPDEIIMADDDGIIVLSEREAVAVLPLAEQIKSREQIAVEKIRSGNALEDIYNFDEHYERILTGDMDSTFSLSFSD